MSRPPVPEGGRRIDLHAHTMFSDGLLSPEELVHHALARRLSALAITDHDSVEALPRARAALDATLELVPGIEVSTTLNTLDLHILGYYVDAEDSALRARLERFREERRERALAIVARLKSLGAPIDGDQVFASAGPGVVGRPHIADALVRAGHVDSLDAAFRIYLGARGNAFVPRPAFRPADAIELIHQAGGVSVLAHPGANLPVAIVEQLVGQGLRGIEVWHPQHGATAVRHYRGLAAKFGLLETGGSDFHGPSRSADLGDMAVPFAVLAALKDAAGVAG
jgi:predicted metal-dependent phosphoesterase TrpH